MARYFFALRLRQLQAAHAVVAIALVAFALTLLPAREAQARHYSAIVVDQETGHVLYARNADARSYPASLTKMMTLYLLFEAMNEGKVDLNDRFTVSGHASGMAPSKLWLKPGETIKVENAILALVTKSANDVAVVVAENLAGSESAFARKMTAKARELGMTRTTFRNASGLPNRHQVSTARDMARLAIALQRDYPRYYHYFSRRQFAWHGETFPNHNGLLGEYPGTDGIKTGYIRASGFNLVTSVHRDGRRLIGVVFGGRTSRSRNAQMRKILDLGFDRMERGVRVASAGLVFAAPTYMSRFGSVPTPADRPALTRLASASTSTVAPDDTFEQVPTPDARPEAQTELADAGVDATDDAADPAAAGGSWAVQVGAFSELRTAEHQLDAVSGVLPTLFTEEAAEVETVKTSAGKLYRARFNGLEETEARKACKVLSHRGLACVAVPPSETTTVAAVEQSG